jgi:hypothetical protein
LNQGLGSFAEKLFPENELGNSSGPVQLEAGSLPSFVRGCGDLTHEYIVRGMVEMIGKLGERFLTSVFSELESGAAGEGVDTSRSWA